MISTVLPMRLRLVANQSSRCSSSMLAGTVLLTAAIPATTTITRPRTSRTTPTRTSIPHTIPVVAVLPAREADIATAAGPGEGAGVGGGTVTNVGVPASTIPTVTEAETSMQVVARTIFVALAGAAAAHAAHPAASTTEAWGRIDKARAHTVPRGVHRTKMARGSQDTRMGQGPTRTWLPAWMSSDAKYGPDPQALQVRMSVGNRAGGPATPQSRLARRRSLRLTVTPLHQNIPALRFAVRLIPSHIRISDHKPMAFPQSLLRPPPFIPPPLYPPPHRRIHLALLYLHKGM